MNKFISTSISEEAEAEPDQETCQRRSPSRSSSASRGGRGSESERVDSRVWIKNSGRETKQLSIPATALT